MKYATYKCSLIAWMATCDLSGLWQNLLDSDQFLFKIEKLGKGTSSTQLMKHFLCVVLWNGKKGFALQVFFSPEPMVLFKCHWRNVDAASSFSSSVPSPSLLPPLACCSSEGHELKFPLGLPLWHPHRVGGVLRHLHDADGERLISLVDMVSHYLAGGKGDNKGS